MIKNIFAGFSIALAMVTTSWATTGASGSPTALSYSIDSALPVSVSWQVAGPAGAHLSSVGRFTEPGTVNEINSSIRVNTNININCINVIGVNLQTSFVSCTPTPEILMVPASIISTALSDGLQAINYSRSFTDGSVVSTATITINLTSNGLNITRELLRFNDHSTRKVIAKGASLFASAELSYTGGGLFNAQ